MERCELRKQLGSHIQTPGSVRECEGKNPHIPKWTPTLGFGILMESQIFRKQFEESKFIGLSIFLYHWNFLKMYMCKMGLCDPFEYL
jgi:hypothetical protein